MASIILAGCTRCGACLEACPTNAIVASAPHFAIDPDLCDNHALCIPVCPEDAIVPGGKGQSK